MPIEVAEGTVAFELADFDGGIQQPRPEFFIARQAEPGHERHLFGLPHLGKGFLHWSSLRGGRGRGSGRDAGAAAVSLSASAHYTAGTGRALGFYPRQGALNEQAHTFRGFGVTVGWVFLAGGRVK